MSTTVARMPLIMDDQRSGQPLTNAEQDALDDDAISKLITDQPGAGLDFGAILEEKGEKADNAIDYEDDESLADDEEVPQQPAINGEAMTLDGEGDDMEDLFGGGPSSPVEPNAGVNGLEHSSAADDLDLDLFGEADDADGFPVVEAPQPVKPIVQPTVHDESPGEPVPEDDDPEARVQQELFEQARRDRQRRDLGIADDAHIAEPPKDKRELLETLFPDYDPDERPTFTALQRQRRAYYLAKEPLKPPKAVQPAKVGLENQQDQEKAFKLQPLAPTNRETRRAEAEQRGLVLLDGADKSQESNDSDMELDVLDEDEKIGNISMRDLSVLCQDWDDLPSMTDTASESGEASPPEPGYTFEVEDDWAADARPTKVRLSHACQFLIISDG